MRVNTTCNSCRGLTLVELMISLALSLLIMAGAVSIFMGSKETFILEENISRVQENYRYLADRLTKDLSLVGYTGCPLPYDDNSSTVDNRLVTGGARDVIDGTEGVADPDKLTLSYARAVNSAKVLVGSAADTKSPINISTDSYLYKALEANFAENEDDRVPMPLLVANCDGGDIFVTTELYKHDDEDPDSPPSGEVGLKHETGKTVGGISNAEASFRVNYGDIKRSSARIYFTEEVTYEICTLSGETGLCVTRADGNKEMLMPDVSDFQVKYGIDSPTSEDGNADRYVDWPGTASIPDITSIKVTVTMVLDQVGGNDITKVYSFTVKLRNMGLNV
jgi:type IV pilus assembly protein PilW